MPNNQAAITRVSVIDAAIRAVEGPFRRFAWHLRTSGIVEGVTLRIAGAIVLTGALASAIRLATALIVAL